ncbi:thermonuclease family protein [Paenibacillus sp. CMAA1364]
MRIYLYIVLALSIIISGCMNTGTEDVIGQSPFAMQMDRDYPELLDKEYEMEVVKRVVDGDTFVTVSGHKVRLIGINTPEVFGEVGYYGQEASDFSTQHLEGKTVYLFKDVRETDKYDRWLRFVFVEDDPVMFNETLIMEGYANTMSIPPDILYSEKFSHLKREAQNNQIGLWNNVISNY